MMRILRPGSAKLPNFLYFFSYASHQHLKNLEIPNRSGHVEIELRSIVSFPYHKFRYKMGIKHDARLFLGRKLADIVGTGGGCSGIADAM